MAYRLFHLLSPDVRAAFIASADVRWTIVVGAIWVVGLLVLASVFVLRLINAHVTAPITDLAHITESVAKGELSVPFAPSTSINEVGRLSRATSSIIMALRRLATTMKTSARDTTTLSAQITACFRADGGSSATDSRHFRRTKARIDRNGLVRFTRSQPTPRSSSTFRDRSGDALRKGSGASAGFETLHRKTAPGSMRARGRSRY